MAKRLRNRFNVLLAEKAFRDGRSSIPRREVVEKTGLVKTTVDRFANNDVTMYDNRVLLLICEYLECTPGDILVIEEFEALDSQPSLLME